MKYKFNEYEYAIDTPNKRLEEKAIVERIMLILNENKSFNSLDDFLNRNKTIDEFKSNNNMDVVLKHFGNNITQEDYEKIINSLKKLTEQKLSFDKEEIRTSTIEDKEYVAYKGKDENIYLNNSYSDKSIEEQMKDLQKENSDLQTSDIKENTERIMQEMKKDKKIELTLRYLNEINYEVLNEEQQQLFKFVFDYQKKLNELIRVDLDEKVMVDNSDNIIKIEKIDGEFKIINSDEKYNNSIKSSENQMNEEKSNQLSIKKLPKVQLFEGGINNG